MGQRTTCLSPSMELFPGISRSPWSLTRTPASHPQKWQLLCVIKYSLISQKKYFEFYSRFTHKETGTETHVHCLSKWLSQHSLPPPILALYQHCYECFSGSQIPSLLSWQDYCFPLANTGPRCHSAHVDIPPHSFPSALASAQNTKLDSVPCFLALSHQLVTTGHPQRLGPMCLCCSRILFLSKCTRLHPQIGVDMLNRRKTKFTYSLLYKGMNKKLCGLRQMSNWRWRRKRRRRRLKDEHTWPGSEGVRARAGPGKVLVTCNWASNPGLISWPLLVSNSWDPSISSETDNYGMNCILPKLYVEVLLQYSVTLFGYTFLKR